MECSEYDRIVETYLDTVYRAALGFCGSVQDAEDIVQNTFLKLLLKAPEFQDEEHIRRWLLRVAANESNSLWRSFWKKRTVDICIKNIPTGRIVFYPAVWYTMKN